MDNIKIKWYPFYQVSKNIHTGCPRKNVRLYANITQSPNNDTLVECNRSLFMQKMKFFVWSSILHIICQRSKIFQLVFSLFIESACLDAKLNREGLLKV